MRANVGDRIVLAARRVNEPTRDGRIAEVRGPEGQPPFLVEWSDGHTGLLYPGSGTVLQIVGDHEPEPPPQEVATPHVREWSVRISIFESGDDTSASAVLLADAPEHLVARGESHRSSRDALVPEIGDEVAVARALRHLADKLMSTAEADIEELTGEDVFVRRS